MAYTSSFETYTVSFETDLSLSSYGDVFTSPDDARSIELALNGAWEARSAVGANEGNRLYGVPSADHTNKNYLQAFGRTWSTSYQKLRLWAEVTRIAANIAEFCTYCAPSPTVEVKFVDSKSKAKGKLNKEEQEEPSLAERLSYLAVGGAVLWVLASRTATALKHSFKLHAQSSRFEDAKQAIDRQFKKGLEYDSVRSCRREILRLINQGQAIVQNELKDHCWDSVNKLVGMASGACFAGAGIYAKRRAAQAGAVLLISAIVSHIFKGAFLGTGERNQELTGGGVSSPQQLLDQASVAQESIKNKKNIALACSSTNSQPQNEAPYTYEYAQLFPPNQEWGGSVDGELPESQQPTPWYELPPSAPPEELFW